VPVDAWLEEVFGDAARAKSWADERVGEMLMVEPERLDEHRDEQMRIHPKIHPAVRWRQA
jgi:hypothetical protein